MATTNQYRSHHSTYPLQAPLQSSRRSSIATSDSGESQSRYRYSIVSQQENSTNGCPFKHIANGNNGDLPSTAGPVLHGLPSPVFSTSDKQSWSNGVDDLAVSSQASSSSWMRSSLPGNPVKVRHTRRESISSALQPEHVIDRSPSRLSQASSTATAGRILRRSLRSRRIESPILVHEQDAPSTSGSNAKREPSTTEARDTQWDHTADSVHSFSNSVPGTFPESPSEERIQDPFSVTQGSPIAIRRPQTVGQEMVSTSRFSVQSSGQDGDVSFKPAHHLSTHQDHGSKVQGAANENWHRRVYPLQTPASNTTLRSLLTPPPSPPQEDHSCQTETVSQAEDQSIRQGSMISRPSRRQAYPLQAPASAANLRPDPETPPPENATDNKIDASEEGRAHDDVPKVVPQNFESKPLRRQAYPLQSPASILDLQPPPPETLLENDLSQIEKQTPTDSIKVDQTVRASRHMRRQAYPLQAPASTFDLQQHGTLSLTEENPIVNEVTVPVPHSPASLPRSNKSASRRRAYPLQAPASVADLQKDQSSAPVEPTIQPEPELAAEHTPKREQKSHASSLRRQRYPLQAPASVADLHQAQSSLPARSSLQDEKPSISTAMDEQEPKDSMNARSQRQQAYPLQTPASTAQPLQDLEPIQSERTGIQTKQEIPRIQTEEIASPTSPTPLWRRQSYPLQVLGDVMPSRSVTPQPSAGELARRRGPVLLPKHIPAVTDAETSIPGGRTIVVCLDGTGDKFDADNSNIVHLVSALKKDDSRQVTYYQAGIGTYSRNGLSSGFAAAMDMAVGSGLGEHVRDAYHFLMHSYKEGDKICIFGFSRGAYTARCLAGMVHKVGLLPPRNIQQIPFAYEFYANDTAEGWKQSIDFKKTFSIDVNVHFLGCFDSVASVGFIPRQLPLSSTPVNKPIYFRHAMALDERRAKFKICRHQTKNWEEIERPKILTNGIQEVTQPRSAKEKSQTDEPKLYSPSEYGASNHPNLTDEEYRRLMEPDDDFDTDVLEVWFAGAHADVGGGAVPNVERHKLAQIPLRWMIRQAFECNTGILFKTKILAEHGLDVHTLWPRYERLKTPAYGPPPSFLEKYEKGLPPRAIRRSKLVPTDQHNNGEQLYHLKSHTDEDWTPEQVEDFYDAISPLNDQLIQAPTWWILELWPVQLKMPVTPGKYYLRTGMNLGRYRAVEDHEPNLHWTVLQRMQQMGYKIDVRATKQTKWKTVV